MGQPLALTIDVEPDWGVRGTRAFTQVTPRFLRFLERLGIRGTFFVCSSLLDVSADLVTEMAERNEIASHGCSHRPLSGLSRGEALREMRRSRRRLQKAGRPVRGFRAPFFRRCRGHAELVRSAGYAYDASVGSLMPGPRNVWLEGMDHPRRIGPQPGLPTSAAGLGILPLSLTWLRVAGPRAARAIVRPSVFYLHLHEFLPPDTTRNLPLPLRALLGLNCGQRAWYVLEKALEKLECTFVTCWEMVEASTREETQ